MATVFDYLKWRGDLSFAQDPLNPVDGLIFCTLSYIPSSVRRRRRPMSQSRCGMPRQISCRWTTMKAASGQKTTR